MLAIVQREPVDSKAWLTQEEFIEDGAAAQIMPGQNVVNLSPTTAAISASRARQPRWPTSP